MIPPVYRLLSESPDIVAIVADRIGEHGRVYPNEMRPYITWQMVAGGAEIQLDIGRACHDRVAVQIDCWHAASAGVVALADAARAAVESECHFVGLVADEQDAETRLYHIGMQFDFIL